MWLHLAHPSMIFSHSPKSHRASHPMMTWVFFRLHQRLWLHPERLLSISLHLQQQHWKTVTKIEKPKSLFFCLFENEMNLWRLRSRRHVAIGGWLLQVVSGACEVVDYCWCMGLLLSLFKEQKKKKKRWVFEGLLLLQATDWNCRTKMQGTWTFINFCKMPKSFLTP